MNRMYFLLAIMLVMTACNKNIGQDTTNPIIQEKDFASLDEVKSYLKMQAEAIGQISPPDESYYREILSAEQIPVFRNSLWKAWCEANDERLVQSQMLRDKIQQSGFITGYGDCLQTSGLETVWNIPQNERMKIKMFYKSDSPQEKYPMFISLHGGGAYPHLDNPWGSDEINTGQYIASIDLAREWMDAPSFYFIPRMADDRKGSWYYAPQVHTFKKAMQLGLVSGTVNERMLYLLGISQGGYGTLRLAMFMPDYFSAVAVLDACEEVTETICNLRNTPILVKVGEKDYEHGRVQYAYQWQEAWKSIDRDSPEDFTGEMVVVKGKGHGYLNHDDVTGWLKRHERKTNPDHVTYVYHNIAPESEEGGCFSQGVYCLDFRALTRESNRDRILFDVVKSGNDYKITTRKISGDISGKLTIFLDNIDLEAPVHISLNGKTAWKEKVEVSRGVMIESLALWGDPQRIYPSKVTLNL